MARYRLCFEEELEIDKLHEATTDAKSKSAADIEAVHSSIDEEIAAKAEESDDGVGDDSMGDDAGDGSEDDGDDDSADSESSEDDAPLEKGDSETPDDAPDSKDDSEEDDSKEDGDDDKDDNEDDAKPATESFRGMSVVRVSTEDYEIAKVLAHKAIDAVQITATTLGALGVKYGPTIARNVFKGLLFAVTRLGKLTLNGIAHLSHYTSRRINSFQNLKAQVSQLKKQLSTVHNPRSISGQAFTSQKYIDMMKSGSNTDVNKNIMDWISFLDSSVSKLSNNIDNDIDNAKHIMQLYSKGDAHIPGKIIRPLIPGFLTPGNVEGYEAPSELSNSYTYNKTLVGDVTVMAYLPATSITDLNTLRKAYNESEMFMAAAPGYKKSNGIEYKSASELSSLLDTLEHLCDVCLKHQSTYESILRKKKELRLSVRNYIQRLVSGHHITVQESLIEQVSIKVLAIDRLYLSLMMDLHDYSARVINAGMAYSRGNIKLL